MASRRRPTTLEANGYVGPLMLEIQALDRQDHLPDVLAEARASIEFMKQVG